MTPEELITSAESAKDGVVTQIRVEELREAADWRLRVGVHAEEEGHLPRMDTRKPERISVRVDEEVGEHQKRVDLGPFVRGPEANELRIFLVRQTGDGKERKKVAWKSLA